MPSSSAQIWVAPDVLVAEKESTRHVLRRLSKDVRYSPGVDTVNFPVVPGEEDNDARLVDEGIEAVPVITLVDRDVSEPSCSVELS